MLTINTHIKQNKKFSAASIGCFLRLPLTKHNLSFASLLAKMQMNATLYFPSIQKQQEELLRMYNLQFEIMPQLFGKEIVLSYFLNFVEPAELLDPEYNYEKIVELFSMLVQHPEFDRNLVELSQKQLLAEYHEMMSEPSNYAMNRFFKNWYRDTPEYGESFMGSIDEIMQATPGMLIKFYENLRTVPTLVAGIAKDSKLMNSLLHDHFKQAGLLKNFENDELTIPAPNLKIDKTETSLNYQTQLFMGFGYQGKQSYVDQVQGMILAQYLAGDSSSKLFTEIREDAGAAYDVEANNYSNNSLFLITTGIADKQIDIVKNIVLREIQAIKNGDIDENLFIKSKKSLINEQLIASDHINWQLAQILRENLFVDYADFDRFQAIKNSRRSQLINFTKKLFLNESYVLR